MKSIAAISWCMPPALFPRSVQVARTLKGLRSLGWSSTVITPETDAIPGAFIDRGLGEAYAKEYAVQPVSLDRVSRDFGPWAQRWRQRLRGEDGLTLDELWIARAARAATAEIRRRRPSVLLSFAQPWSDHLAGLRVARQHRLPWVAHFSDPWTDSIYDESTGAARELELEREGRVIRGADRIVFTNQHAADLVMRKYPAGVQGKVRVVPHAMDPGILPPTPGAAARGPLRIAHVGNLFLGLRTGHALFEALQELHARRSLEGRLELVFQGEGSGAREAEAQVFVRQLERVIKFQPRVPYLDSLTTMQAVDVLLVVDAPSPVSVFLPSKIVDCLMVNKPLLALTPAVGATADVIRQVGGTMADPEDAAGVAAALERLLDAHRDGALQAPDASAVSAQFGLPSVAGQFDAILNEAMESR